MEILRIFKLLNYLLGTTVVVSAFIIYIIKKETIPLYVALAIIIAGPLEDLLYAYIGNKEQYKKIIDNTTSLAFLILLGLVVLESNKR